MNIFARELEKLLRRHNKLLGSLYSFHSASSRIVPAKVTRLKKSLKRDMTATLNADELALVAEALGWHAEGEEVLRLRAALLAENVRHLLGGRMNQKEAVRLAEIAFQMFLCQEVADMQMLCSKLLEGVR
jgi:hypothetical protein